MLTFIIVLWTVTTIMAIAITAGVMSHNRQEETNKFLLESCRILNGRVTTCESTIRRLVAALEKIPEAPNVPTEKTVCGNKCLGSQVAANQEECVDITRNLDQ